MLRHVVWQKFTDVSEERTASIFRDEEQTEQRSRQAAIPAGPLPAYSTYSSALNKKLRSSGTSVNAYQTTRRRVTVTAVRITSLTSTLIGISIKTYPNVKLLW
jgi:hypothetical protein